MAMNCPQQVKPRAWRSARCFTTNASNSRRGKNCRSCENMLHTRFTAESPLVEIEHCQYPISIYRTFRPLFKNLIWTSLVYDRRPVIAIDSDGHRPPLQQASPVQKLQESWLIL